MAKPMHRFYDQQLRSYAVDSGTVIAKGDMVWLDTDDIKPASDFTWDTNIATTQASFAAKFVGIAVESSAAGETENVSVDVSAKSVWEMDCASANFVAGGPVGPAKQSGNLLENQKVVTAVAASSIGFVNTTGTSLTRVEVQFQSAYAASSNVNANVG
jgi:hypothetical protein